MCGGKDQGSVPRQDSTALDEVLCRLHVPGDVASISADGYGLGTRSAGSRKIAAMLTNSPVNTSPPTMAGSLPLANSELAARATMVRLGLKSRN